MRKFKKLLLVMVCTLSMLMLFGCGDSEDSASENETDAQTETESTEPEVETEYATFEEYLENDKYALSSMETVASANDTTITCSGNVVYMTKVMSEIAEDDVEMYAEVFESAFNTTSVDEEFDEIKADLTADTGYVISIVYQYVTSEGTLIYEKTFE